MASFSKLNDGQFQLSEGIKAFGQSGITPSQGYRRDYYDVYEDEWFGRIHTLIISLSKELLLDVFLDCLDIIGDTVNVVCETSHFREDGTLGLYTRDDIDLVILKSHLHGFIDVLMDDGCAGIAAYNPDSWLEVQFDEHKLLTVYASDPKKLVPFEDLLLSYKVALKPSIKFIYEGPHMHSSSVDFKIRFDLLCQTLNAELDESSLPW